MLLFGSMCRASHGEVMMQSVNVGIKRARQDDSDIEYDDQVTMAQMQEVYGEYATSLTERVKRRRNQHNTYHDGSDDNNSNVSDSHLQSAFRSRLPADDTSSDASNASLSEGLQCSCCVSFFDVN